MSLNMSWPTPSVLLEHQWGEWWRRVRALCLHTYWNQKQNFHYSHKQSIITLASIQSGSLTQKCQFNLRGIYGSSVKSKKLYTFSNPWVGRWKDWNKDDSENVSSQISFQFLVRICHGGHCTRKCKHKAKESTRNFLSWGERTIVL